MEHRAVCAHNLCKLLLINGFIHMQMLEIGSGNDKELISFAILFMLNILYDVIHDVVDKHVYV